VVFETTSKAGSRFNDIFLRFLSDTVISRNIDIGGILDTYRWNYNIVETIISLSIRTALSSNFSCYTVKRFIKIYRSLDRSRSNVESD
jgi:hypothetical protein